MRIVYDMQAKADVSTGGHPWAKPKGHVPVPGESFMCDVHIHWKSPLSDERDNIYIEGDSACIREALMDAVGQIDMMQKTIDEVS